MVRQEFAEVHDTHRCARAASGRGRTARLLLHSIMLVEFRFTLLSLWAAYIQSYRHTRGLGNNERGLRNNERGRKNERCVRGNRSPNKGYIVNFSCGVIRSFNYLRSSPWQAWHAFGEINLSLCVAGVVLGDIDLHFAWQSVTLIALGWLWWRAWVPFAAVVAPAVCGRRGTWRNPPSFFVASVALVALGWLWLFVTHHL